MTNLIPNPLFVLVPFVMIFNLISHNDIVSVSQQFCWQKERTSLEKTEPIRYSHTKVRRFDGVRLWFLASHLVANTTTTSPSVWELLLDLLASSGNTSSQQNPSGSHQYCRGLPGILEVTWCVRADSRRSTWFTIGCVVKDDEQRSAQAPPPPPSQGQLFQTDYPIKTN